MWPRLLQDFDFQFLECLLSHDLARQSGPCPSLFAAVKTAPQMTRFRDAKVCNNLATDEIDDHRIQSDYKCTSGLQNPEGKNSTLGIASAW